MRVLSFFQVYPKSQCLAAASGCCKVAAGHSHRSNSACQPNSTPQAAGMSQPLRPTPACPDKKPRHRRCRGRRFERRLLRLLPATNTSSSPSNSTKSHLLSKVGQITISTLIISINFLSISTMFVLDLSTTTIVFCPEGQHPPHNHCV